MEIISKKIYKLLLENNNFLIITHKNPDGDAIGSVLAIKYFLENHGKNAHVFSSTIINEQFDFLPNFFSIKKKYIPKEDFDAIIVCDTGDIKHTGVKEEFIKKHKNIVNIDHHKSNDFFGTHNLISEKSSSTTEILFHFFKYNNIEIDNHIATMLLLGIITDTSNFSNAGTSKNALKIASYLLKKGANFHKIKKNIIQDKTIEKLRSWGFMLSKLKKDIDKKIVYTYITIEEMMKNNIEEESLDGITNLMNDLNDANIAIVLKESKDNTYKVSMRSLNEKIDVAEIAKKFNGGGHRKAAGFNTTEKNIQKIIDEIAKTFSKVNK